ncbi:MAG: holo-ACP synthase [Lentisphaeria bacterium]|nr:holo-ACP synthase [Lentisphaeria bacterium]
MLKGCGIDIVEIARIEDVLSRHQERFLHKLLTPNEIELYYERKKSGLAFVAGRWAVKEAFAKALGTGIGSRCQFTEIEVLNNDSGKPILCTLGTTKETTQAFGIQEIHISISHEQNYAVAQVILT